MNNVSVKDALTAAEFAALKDNYIATFDELVAKPVDSITLNDAAQLRCVSYGSVKAKLFDKTAAGAVRNNNSMLDVLRNTSRTGFNIANASAETKAALLAALLAERDSVAA
jgi:hypothetical protein